MPNTGYTAHLRRINGDALEVCHGSIVASCDITRAIASSRDGDVPVQIGSTEIVPPMRSERPFNTPPYTRALLTRIRIIVEQTALRWARNVHVPLSLTFVSRIASASESLSRGLGSKWFTERFHGYALVRHFQHRQVCRTARRFENYAIARF